MYRRVISWSRPSTDVKWPWEDDQFKQLIDINLKAMMYAEGFVEKSFVSETDLTLVNNNDWVSREHWSAYCTIPVVVGYHSALDLFVANTGLVKTVSDMDI